MSLREQIAYALWHAHPARPGPEYAALRESQWWSRERIAELQTTWLRRLVSSAARTPFYRDRFAAAGVGPADIRTIEDVGRLPILEREDLAEQGIPGLRTPGSWGLKASSSGSLGRRVQILWPLAQMRWLDAGEARARSWLGSEVGERRLEVRCRPVGRPQAVSAALLNTEALHAPAVADRDVARRLLSSLAHRPPTFVWGVSNALFTVALALAEEGRTVRAKACWSGGNHLHPHYRKAMEEAFGCEVYERYATMETGLLAHECREARSLHVPAEGVVVEIVRPDGSAAAGGEVGDVVVTSLRNHATPLIRYRLGDRAVAPTDPQCSCGRGLPVFGRVVGRAKDVLRTEDGGLITPREAVAAAAPAMGSVIDFQVLQKDDARLQIHVVQRDSPTAEEDRDRLVRIFEELVRPPERPLVDRVDRIGLTPGGKVRTLVSGGS